MAEVKSSRGWKPQPQETQETQETQDTQQIAVEQPKPKEQPAPKKSTVTVVNVYGPMWHTDVNCWIDGPTEFPKIDGWLKSQIDAGKLAVQ